MGKIRLLDESTIKMIAAGEIIERPASVVKELVENSLDAKASNITVEIANGGKDYIRVTDDGEGLLEDDLNIAFKRHSTSKIYNADDLYNILSFGFRGEALASISTVAKVEVLTKTQDSISGIQAFVEEGKIIDKKPIGCPKGTTMIVRDLFYNVPVRKKFLKSDKTEANHIDDILYRLALGNSHISFKYVKDNKIIFKTRKNDIASNIYTLLGKEFHDNLFKIEYTCENFKIYGYISNNTFYRGNRKHQYLYINKRYVNNKDISNLIEEKYKSLIPVNRFPVFIIFIDIKPSLIDVNIHPTKQEVKFINHQEILEALDSAITRILNKNLYIQKVTFNHEENKKSQEPLPLLYEESFIDKNVKKTNLYDKQYSDKNNVIKEEVFLDRADIYDSKSVKVKEKKDEISHIVYEKDSNIDVDKNKKKIDFLQDVKIIGVLFSTYILMEDSKSNKLLIMDQHAAHERVMYEKYKAEYTGENIAIQTLLTPEILELTSTEMDLVLDNIDTFQKLGFIVEEFGQNSIIIRGVPILFGKPQLKSSFLELIDSLKNNVNSSYEVKIDKIMKIACTKAIKSGDKISEIEIESLIEQLKNTKNPYTCPHGRPTIIEISKKDIEKEFKRIM